VSDTINKPGLFNSVYAAKKQNASDGMKGKSPAAKVELCEVELLPFSSAENTPRVTVTLPGGNSYSPDLSPEAPVDTTSEGDCFTSPVLNEQPSGVCASPAAGSGPKLEFTLNEQAYFVSRPVKNKRQEMPEAEFTPEHPLISSVSVYKWGTSYSYYDGFIAAAERLKDLTSDEDVYIPFFSYMPQYSQLTTDQLGFYLWLRSRIRAGEYPRADYGYLMLMIYEAINLAGCYDGAGKGIDPEEALAMLTNIWKGYREEHPRLDDQLAEWVCDFCLLHRLALPYERISPFIRSALKSATLKEFYIEPSEDGDSFAAFLLTFVSGYDYKKSKYASGDGAPLFEKHMKGVLKYILDSGEAGLIADPAEKTVSRDAYVGAVCLPYVKKRLSVTYKSFSVSYENRFLISTLLKYSENKLRAMLGVRSRLATPGLPESIKKLCDDYFAGFMPKAPEKKPDAAILPEWEKLYEPEARELSMENAASIEKASWETTDVLVSAFQNESMGDGFGTPGSGNELKTVVTGQKEYSVALDPDINGITGTLYADASFRNGENGSILSGDSSGSCKAKDADSPEECEIKSPGEPESASEGRTDSIFSRFIGAVLDNDRGMLSLIAKEAGMPVDMLAGEVNFAACDAIGDVILEPDGDGWQIIPDYIEEAGQIVKGSIKL